VYQGGHYHSLMIRSLFYFTVAGLCEIGGRIPDVAHAAREAKRSLCHRRRRDPHSVRRDPDSAACALQPRLRRIRRDLHRPGDALGARGWSACGPIGSTSSAARSASRGRRSWCTGRGGD